MRKEKSKFATALILSGGQSKRMGFDKQLLELNRKRLMHSMIASLSKTFSDVIVVTQTPQYYQGLPVRILQDRFIGQGPLAGLEIGLAEARSEYVFLRACDMPVYNESYARYMMQCVRDYPKTEIITTLVNGQIEPFNSYYHYSLHKELVDLLHQGKRSFRALMDQKNTFYVGERIARIFDPNLEQFINLNTKEEYQQYLKKLS